MRYTYRSQRIWPNWQPDRRERLARLVALIMRRTFSEASVAHRWSFVYFFALFQSDFSASEVDIGRGEVLHAIVIASMVVMLDEGISLLPEITRQVVVIQRDAVLGGLMPSLALAVGLNVIRCALDMVHFLIFLPVTQCAHSARVAVVQD